MRRVLLFVAGIGLLILLAYMIYSWVKTDHVSDGVSVEKDNAESLDVKVRFGAGNLVIEGGASKWVTGEIDTTEKKWYPTVSYKHKRDVGYVEIQQKKKRFSVFRKNRNNWDLQFTNEIPVDLDVEMGASDSKLNLNGIDLSHLTVDAGVSDIDLDLRGDWSKSFDAELNLGVGDAEIYLPKKTGVKLSVSKGISGISTEGLISKGKGIYVNEAYNHSDVVIQMDVNVGVGNVTFSLEE